MVTPSYMLAIVDEMERQGIDPRASSLEVGIFGAEPWTDEMRREIEQRLDMHAVDIYGLSEVIGPGVAQECVETKDGLHVWEDHFYPEIIDPVTGEVLPDGEEGELVFTSLTKQAMPVIRYRTRDLTRLLPGTARTMRRMEKITGRTDDMIILRGVNLFPTQIEELILAHPRAVAALPVRADPLRHPRRADRAGRAPRRRRRETPPRPGRRTLEQLVKSDDRRVGRRRRRRPGRRRAVDRQDAPDRGRAAGALTSAPPGGPPEPDTDADHRAAQADQLLRSRHLVVHGQAAEQIGGVGTAGREEPASGVAPAQRRVHQ